ncbi:uncharacterized protein [Parasteatoda tepidariorum]|uniref:uncharacterized protein n=1 Tax=Parasteatoda tepidariorum TaxID=114398 RepID=UPI0039BC6295
MRLATTQLILLLSRAKELRIIKASKDSQNTSSPTSPTPVITPTEIEKPISNNTPEITTPAEKQNKKRKKSGVNPAILKNSDSEPESEPHLPEKKIATVPETEEITPDPIISEAPVETPVEITEQIETLQSTSRELKVLIRGLKADIEIHRLEKTLSDIDLRPFKIEQMKKRRGQELKLLPLYLVFLIDVQEHREILKIDLLLDTPDRVERFRSGRYEIKCFRCQGFDHTQSSCTAKPACMKCAGAHFTYLCTKPHNEPPTCVNCHGEHPACFAGCGARPRSKTAPKKRQNRSAASSATRFLHIVREQQELLKDAELVSLLQSLLPTAKT